MKEKAEQDDIEKRIESITPVKIRPLDLERMRQRVMKAIRMNLRDEDEEIQILQMAPTEIRTCNRGPRCSRGES